MVILSTLANGHSNEGEDPRQVFAERLGELDHVTVSFTHPEPPQGRLSLPHLPAPRAPRGPRPPHAPPPARAGLPRARPPPPGGGQGRFPRRPRRPAQPAARPPRPRRPRGRAELRRPVHPHRPPPPHRRGGLPHL